MHSQREILNAIFYIVRSGCTWRMLPHDLPPLLMVMVHAANFQDRDGAKLLLEKAQGRFPRLRLIWADGGYAGKLVDGVKTICRWVLEIVKRRDDVKGFQVLPHRWVVERTFGWLGRYWRLSKDYEELPESSEAMISIATIHLDGQTAGASASTGHGLTRGLGCIRFSEQPDAEQGTSHPPCRFQIAIHAPLAVSLRR